MHAWVYNIPGLDYLIIKRSAFSCQIPYMDTLTGNIHYEVIQGVMIEIPNWEWIKKDEKHIFAGFGAHVYEISELQTYAPV